MKPPKRSGKPPRNRPHKASPHKGSPHKGGGRGRGAKHFERRAQEVTLIGTIQKNRRGFAFVIFEDSRFEDLFLEPRRARRFFPGDRVRVVASGDDEILSIDVLEHRMVEVVGRYLPYPRPPGGVVVYELKNIREEIHCFRAPRDIRPGDWVRTRVSFPHKGPHSVVGDIVEVFGQDLPATADLSMIAGEFGLIERHPQEAEVEAKSFTLDVEKALADGHRQDLRDIPFMTIDGEDARDFDDAVHVAKTQKGHELWVAIADVSHYVKPGSKLDASALERGTSVYFPERAFHMLPKALSENLCSLRPNEPRLSVGVHMIFDESGHRKHMQPFEAVIESRRRATYNEIEAEKAQWPEHFALFGLLRKQRLARGSIDFDLPEPKVMVDDKCEPVSIEDRKRFDAHRLIEEFMIAANEAVTDWIRARKRPFLYRIHETPSEESLETFFRFARGFGLSPEGNPRNPTPRMISGLVKQMEGLPAEPLLRTTLLRSMKQAVYSESHDIHFGLASQAYTHFTSPIRRYPDLVVHRLLRQEMRKLGRPHEDKKTIEELRDTARHCSYRERLAADAERTAVKFKQVRFAARHIGQDFDGIVSGLSERGAYIQISTPFLEGMIPRESFLDDRFEFIEAEVIYLARASRRVIRIGDPVRVQIAKASLELRQNEFKLITHHQQTVREPKRSEIDRPAKSAHRKQRHR